MSCDCFVGGSATGFFSVLLLAFFQQYLGAATSYVQVYLVSDVPGLALDTDLKNPWRVSFSSGSRFWVSNRGSNTATAYGLPSSIGGATLSPNPKK
jgi:hypothetical protein